MKLAFCLYRYFPFGGLQRDFLRIARTCLQRGHEITVYTGAWEGEKEPGLQIEILPTSGWQNHTRCRSFSRELAQRLEAQNYDLVVGFNKMPGLDVYYAADVCYQSRIQKLKPFWYPWLPRYRQYLRDERVVFSPQQQTQILTLARTQEEEYRSVYPLPASRFHLLPPGISRDRRVPPQAETLREELRREQAIQAGELVLLMVGSGFKTKGLDRVLNGMSALSPELKSKTRLWVVGQDNAAPFLNPIRRLGLANQVKFLGGRHDVARFFLASDLLVHPAYHENTGTVILEALVAGLPVLTVDVCGYAPYVTEAQAGRVLPSPFEQKQFNQALQDLLLSPFRAEWKKNALAFAKIADIYNLPEKAADLIESFSRPPHPCHPATRVTGSRFEEFMRLQGEIFREQKGRRTQRVTLSQETYFIKQHFGVGWKEIFKNLLQFKLPILGARNEWRALERLRQLGVLAPAVKAHGSRGWDPARRRSFLLMEELKNRISLEDFCRNWKNQPPSFALKMALLRKVASIAKIMHENGINHRDFYICHFLLEPRTHELSLIDLHRAGLHRHLPRRWRIKDLAGLYFSSKDLGLTPRDYWRFIKAYRQKPLRDIIMQEEKFWQKVISRGEQLYHAHVQA